MITVEPLLVLKTLINFILEQASEFDLGIEEELTSVVSDMYIYTWVDLKPGNIAVWYDWQRHWDLVITQNDTDVKTKMKKAQYFVSAFKFLNDVYWEKNNEITLNTVIQALEKCLSDISENKENPLYAIWLQYLQEEEGSEYSFD